MIKKLIKPAFEKDNVVVTLQSSDYFTPYTAVVIKSIIENTSENNNYDIIITSRDMSQENAEKLIEMTEGRKNISIRVVNVKEIFDEYVVIKDERFGGETITRIFLAELLEDYDKVLNLDCDMIVCSDIAELYNIDITEYYMGAVQDLLTYILCRIKKDNWENKIKNILELWKHLMD